MPDITEIAKRAIEHYGAAMQQIVAMEEMAEDVLCLMLYDLEEEGESIPPASEVSAIKTEKGEFVSLVSCDTLEYRQYYDNKAVKKTLTIPAWLNTMSEREGINFSAVLQSALKSELHITNR